MSFSLEECKRHTARVEWHDLDLASYGAAPLGPEVLRCIRYMHDVEYHTTCYLRELLVTPAHADPAVTGFLTLWAYEEFWHGEALAGVLAAHGEGAGEPRVARVRSTLGWRDHLRPLLMGTGGWLAGEDFIAVQMTWGAINEWTTQAGYAQLARRAGQPVLRELLGRIMRQEGRHIDFYASQARARLANSARAQWLAKAALSRLWHPVGAGFMPPQETAFVVGYLMGTPEGVEAAARIDRRVSSLPGLDGLHLVEKVARAAQHPPQDGLAGTAMLGLAGWRAALTNWTSSASGRGRA